MSDKNRSVGGGSSSSSSNAMSSVLNTTSNAGSTHNNNNNSNISSGGGNTMQHLSTSHLTGTGPVSSSLTSSSSSSIVAGVAAQSAAAASCSHNNKTVNVNSLALPSPNTGYLNSSLTTSTSSSISASSSSSSSSSSNNNLNNTTTTPTSATAITTTTTIIPAVQINSSSSSSSIQQTLNPNLLQSTTTTTTTSSSLSSSSGNHMPSQSTSLTTTTTTSTTTASSSNSNSSQQQLKFPSNSSSLNSSPLLQSLSSIASSSSSPNQPQASIQIQHQHTNLSPLISINSKQTSQSNTSLTNVSSSPISINNNNSNTINPNNTNSNSNNNNNSSSQSNNLITFTSNNNNNQSSNSVTSTSSNSAAAQQQQQQQQISSILTSSSYYNDHQVGNGHFFTKKTFHKPTYCHHCTEMLWGLIGQGFVCEVCNFVCHEKCLKSVVTPCSSIAHSLIKNPVPHCWSEPMHFKRKFCNICRKRLEDNPALRCEICEYYVHTDCQVLAVNDCCETATYVPNRNLKSLTHHHHWREGNLPSNSKCAVCKKTCWTSECLAGMKCEWCGITTHSICRLRLVDECNFGNLRDIIVPPYAVSVPRVDMNKETIFGIQTNRSKVRSNSTEWPSGGESKSDGTLESFSCVFPNQQQQQSSSSQTSSQQQQQQQSQQTSNQSQTTFNYLNNLNNSNLTNDNSLLTASVLTSSNSAFSNANANTTSSTSLSPSPTNNGPSSPLPSSAFTYNTNNSNNNNNNMNTTNQDRTSSQPSGGGGCYTSGSTSGSSATTGSSKKKDKIKQQNIDDEEDSKEIIKAYDGNTSFRKRVFRTIAVHKNYSYHNILEASLRTFHINDDPHKYYISIPLSASNVMVPISLATSLDEFQIEEQLVDESNPIKSIKAASLNSNNFDGPKPSILLRYKDNEIESIRIYPGILKDTTCYQNITITSKTTVLESIQMALEKFQINKKNSGDKFSLVEVLLDQDVSERILSPNEFPLQVLRKLRKESLCNNRMVRFYLQQKEDPHGPSVALFVGNLPSGLSQIQYEKILMDTIKNSNDVRWSKFDVIYYEYGSMVILYDDSEKAVKAYKMLKDAYYENKQLMVLLLPTIQPPMIPPNVCPLLVFVNVKSGGQQGAELITSFRHLLNPHQVFDLQNGGPLPGLYVFRNIESYRILACGGDGTIGWVLSCLDNVSQDAKCQSSPMAIVPLGTGNDLARVLRWGAGYTGAEEPINLLRDVIDAEEITLDRWTVVFHADENKELDDMKRQLSIAVNVNQANTNEDNTEIYVMNNYFGIGIEADLCLDFHTAREENPNKFNSRLQNKKYYLQLGIRKMMNRGNCKDFYRNVTLEVDGRRVDLPQIEGIIILNILSWGSGANPWGPEKEDQFMKPTHYDGMLEVVGIKGMVHLGQIQGGLSSAIRLAQGGRIKIRMNSEMPVHVDGEPWMQSPCTITILKSALRATMLKKSKMKIKRRNTEPSVNVPNNNPSANTRAETDPVDPEGESEPF